MKTKCNAKQRLISAFLVLVLTFSSFVATTYSWFTDSVTSSGNKIETGSLKVDLLHKVGSDWVSLKNKPDHKVFNYEKWEPGYTRVETLKVLNTGSLALKYKLSLEVAGGTAVLGDNHEDLADVIDVYVLYGESTDAKFTDITAASSKWVKKGTLNDVFKNPSSFMGGALLPTGKTLTGTETGNTAVGNQLVSVALHMREDAGNGYQGLSVGDVFVNLVATQTSSENDSFGNDYDNGATFPSFSGDYVASAPVEVNGDNTVKNDVVLSSKEDEVSATVYSGTLLEAGVNNVTLTVSSLKNSNSNIELRENQVLNAVDVHVSGVATGNTAPILVTVKKLLAKGLNMGNYELYHIENGATVAMTYVANAIELDAHNEFTYDPATGDVTMALCSFSEITVVNDTENAWTGEFDYSWYDADKKELTIANADQLAAFGAIVGGMNGYTADSFVDKTVTLLVDINLGDDEANNDADKIFYPIGYYNNTGSYDKVSGKVTVDGEQVAVSSYYQPFAGTFDGNGNTIANFYQNTWEMFGDYNDGYSGTPNHSRDGMGLFGKVYGGTVKNLTVECFSSDGEFATTGVIAAYADSGNGKSATFENIAIFDCNPRVYNIGNGGIVGCAGWYSRSDATANGYPVVFRNITVDQTNMISALWGSYDVSCGGILGQYYPDSQCGVSFENCHIAAVMDVNNDVCANYQYYWYRYSGMLIGTIRANKTEGGYTVADTTGITVDGCTYTLGDWNEYWYCELVKNSLASYTHDHQFSRLTKIESLDEIKNGETWLKEGNFVLPAEDNSSAVCYHIFKNSEGELYQHFHDVADETNPEIYETFDLNGDGELNDLKEDRQCYYMPFNQVFNGLGYGVKPTYEITGLTEVTDGPVNSEEKFADKNTVTFYRPGQTITLGYLVSAVVDESKISKATLYVAVSPATEADNVSGTVSIDTGDWANTTITFAEDCVGVAKIVITDYFYCKKTVIYLNPEEAAAKFTANPVASQNAYTQITLGTLFAANAGVSIGNVTATVTDPNGNITTVTGTSTDWASKTIDITKDGKWTVAIKDDDAYCSVTTATFTVDPVDKFEVAFDHDDATEGKQNYVDTYLYRVGNQNTVTLGSLFSEVEAVVNVSSVNISVANVAGGVTYTFTPNGTWTNGTIKFTGTGVIAVTISADGANELTLNLEVVDAKNITSATGSSGTDIVLLNDVQISSGSTVTYSDCFVYGNGFTFDVSGGLTEYVASQGWGIINLSNGATLDNLVITGDVYASYGAYSGNDYNTAAVASLNGTIQNCWISNCAAPVMLRGSTTIKDSTLYGGTVANAIVKGGVNTFENVTTVNYNDDRSIVGAGIVIHSDADDKTQLILEGTFKQYNFLCETPAPTDSNAKILYDAMFDDSCSGYQFGTTPNRYVNTGIISMTSAFGAGNITDNASTGYTGQTVNITVQGVSVEGYVYTQPNTSGSVDNGYVEANDTHKAMLQGDYLPTFEFELGDQEISFDGDSDTRYLYGDASGLNALYQDGDDALTLDLSNLASVTKYGQSLSVTAVCKDPSGNALTDTNGVVTLSASGTYALVFTVTDNIFYNTDGTQADKSVTRTYTVPLTLSVKAADIKDAVVTISSTTLEGTYNQTGTIFDYNYQLKLEFLNCISVTDYTATNTSGSAVDLTADISSATLTNSSSDLWSAATVLTITYTDGRMLTVNLSKFAGSSPGTKTASIVTDDGVYFLTDGALNNKPTEEANKCTCTITSVSFKGNNGATITNDTDVSVSWPIEESGSSGCVAADTMITLSNGTQKRIDEVTYEDELLVWNFFEGKYDVAPASIIFYHGHDTYEVLNLKFSDGTVLKVINDHGLYDADLNKFVWIDANNADAYVGHSFVKNDGEGVETIKLVGYEITEKYTGSYCIQTAMYNDYIAEGLLSLTKPEYEGWFDYFEIGEDMKYDEEKMQADIDTYGLYTYEDFAEYVTYEQFIAFNGPYLKVLVGRGVVTYEQIIELINTYVNPQE